MNNISAGNFSASVSLEKGDLYIWGAGSFGEFQTPHRVKKVTERVTKISLGNNFGVAFTESRTMYTWGDNSYGQLGTGDFKNMTGPTKIDQLTKTDDKVISNIACGSNFVVCLGQITSYAEEITAQ